MLSCDGFARIPDRKNVREKRNSQLLQNLSFKYNRLYDGIWQSIVFCRSLIRSNAHPSWVEQSTGGYDNDYLDSWPNF